MPETYHGGLAVLPGAVLGLVVGRRGRFCGRAGEFTRLGDVGLRDVGLSSARQSNAGLRNANTRNADHSEAVGWPCSSSLNASLTPLRVLDTLDSACVDMACMSCCVGVMGAADGAVVAYVRECFAGRGWGFRR